MEELKTEPGLSLFWSCITFAQKKTYANNIMKIDLCTIHTEALLLPGNSIPKSQFTYEHEYLPSVNSQKRTVYRRHSLELSYL